MMLPEVRGNYAGRHHHQGEHNEVMSGYDIDALGPAMREGSLMHHLRDSPPATNNTEVPAWYTTAHHNYSKTLPRGHEIVNIMHYFPKGHKAP